MATVQGASGAPVIVIGGGLVGLSSALQLQRRGVEVTLLDPGDIEAAASYGNAGQIVVGAVVPVAGPGTLAKVPRWLADPLGPLAIRWRYLPRMIPWLVRFLRAGRRDRVAAISAAMASLSDHVLLDTQGLVDEADAAILLRPSPHLSLYRDRASWEADGPGWALRVKAGQPYALLEGDALRDSEPALGPAVGFAAAMLGRYYVSDPGALMLAYAARFRAQGGAIHVGRATGFRRDGAHVVGVELADGATLPASAVVLAAGAWSHRLAALLGDAIPLETERGYHVMLPNPGVMPRHTMSHVDHGFGVLPMGDRLRLAGTVEFAGLDAAPNWDRARQLMEVAQRFLPNLNTEGARFWMGHRPATPDSLPVIDRASQAANVVYAFGHGHLGLTWAATTGRLVAGLVTNTPTNFDITPFRQARFRRAGAI